MNTSIFFTCSILIATLSSCLKPELISDPPPNILFAIADDASFPHMGAYGTTWINSPSFDRVAREGLLFMNAYTPNAKCAPSRACILTGRNSWALKEAANHWAFFPPEFKTFPEVLAENGYHVGYTLKGWAPGIALDEQGRQRLLTGKPYNQQTLIPPSTHISNIDYAGNFKDFLKERQPGQPFCFWYGSIEPHRSYEFGAGMDKAGKKMDEISQIPAFWPNSDSVRIDLLDYAFEIEWFDRHLGEMLQTLDSLGELNNTVVVVTADNGMPFPRVKGQVYEFSNHLPLAIMWKNGIKNPGKKISSLVSFIDFVPTFLEIANVSFEKSGMKPFQGVSLTELFYSNDNESISLRDYVLVGKERHDVGRPYDVGYPVRGIIKNGYLYLRNFKPDRWPAGNPETGYLNTDGSPTKSLILNQRRNQGMRYYWDINFGKRPDEELYDIKNDPFCMQNLALNEKFNELKTNLQQELARKLEEEDDPRIIDNGDIFDHYVYANDKDRDFYNRLIKGDSVYAGWINETDYENEILD